jgi:hypothetical protein
VIVIIILLALGLVALLLDLIYGIKNKANPIKEPKKAFKGKKSKVGLETSEIEL